MVNFWKRPGPNQLTSPGPPAGTDPDPSNIDKLMKGLAVTHLRRQYLAFEDFTNRLEDLREQQPVLDQHNWTRAIDIPRGIMTQDMNRNLDQTKADARKCLQAMSDSQREKALVTREAAMGIADQFFHGHTFQCLGAIVDNLADQKAPKWSILLDARVYMAQEYANTVARIAKMPPPKAVTRPPPDKLKRESQGNHGRGHGRYESAASLPSRNGNRRPEYEGYVERSKGSKHALS